MADEWAEFRVKSANKPAADDEWAAFRAPQSSGVMDFIKSIPRGLVTGITSGVNPSMVPIQDEQAAVAPTRQAAIETLKAQTPEPQGRLGQVGEAVGASVGNPVSYLGPGGLPLKVGGAILSGAAGEVGRQTAEGTPWETPAAISGALLGGTLAAKTLAPGAPKAAIPTAPELEAASKTGGQYGGYVGARASNLEVTPLGFAHWADLRAQNLYRNDFTAGPNGTAPKTFAVLGDIQNLPADSIVTPANFGAVKKQLQNIAQEVQPTQGGAFKPTADAAAASKVLDDFRSYIEDIPAHHVMAGDAKAFSNAIVEANANNAAFQRVRDFDARLTKAERATDRQIAGSEDAQIKAKAGQLIDRGARGLNEPEQAQLSLIERGGPVSNTMRQLGRGGAGVIPIGGQLALAAATGGALAIPQAAVAAALYGARKGSEALTKSRAKTLVEMMAKRSPEYESRVAGLPPADRSPNISAIVRALLAQ